MTSGAEAPVLINIKESNHVRMIHTKEDLSFRGEFLVKTTEGYRMISQKKPGKNGNLVQI